MIRDTEWLRPGAFKQFKEKAEMLLRAVPNAYIMARFACCHIYSETDDIVYANKNYITVHAAHSGTKTICLPKRRNVVDVYDGTPYGENVDSFCVELLKGETRMFRLL